MYHYANFLAATLIMINNVRTQLCNKVCAQNSVLFRFGLRSLLLFLSFPLGARSCCEKCQHHQGSLSLFLSFATLRKKDEGRKRGRLQGRFLSLSLSLARSLSLSSLSLSVVAISLPVCVPSKVSFSYGGENQEREIGGEKAGPVCAW